MYVLSCFSVSPEIIVTVSDQSNQTINQSNPGIAGSPCGESSRFQEEPQYVRPPCPFRNLRDTFVQKQHALTFSFTWKRHTIRLGNTAFFQISWTSVSEDIFPFVLMDFYPTDFLQSGVVPPYASYMSRRWVVVRAAFYLLLYSATKLTKSLNHC